MYKCIRDDHFTNVRTEVWFVVFLLKQITLIKCLGLGRVFKTFFILHSFKEYYMNFTVIFFKSKYDVFEIRMKLFSNENGASLSGPDKYLKNVYY